MQKKIDFIYFDLGKVILEFDHSIGLNKIGKLTGLDPTTVEKAIFGSGLEDRFETGLVTSDEFHSEFCSATNSTIEKEVLLSSISDIFYPNRPIIPLIAQLRAVGVPMGILSNTCSAHWEFVLARYTFLQHFFDPYILSYEVNSMKPDSKIYHRALEAAGCGVQKCFFVDDRPENVEGAVREGLDAVLYRSVPELVSELTSRGVEINL